MKTFKSTFNLQKLQINDFLVAVVLFVMGLLWWILFPVVSISTGELKARSIFVDENAILVNSMNLRQKDYPRHFPARLRTGNFSLLCNSSINLFSSCRKDLFFNTEILEFFIEPSKRPSSKESTLFVFPVPSKDSDSLVTVFFTELVHRIHNAEWLARNVIILVLRDIRSQNMVQTPNSMMYSRSLKRWLSTHLNAGVVDTTIEWDRPSTGLLRQAFVLDVAEYVEHMMPGNIQVQSVGYNGDLPNMDLVATTLALAPEGSITECGAHSISTVVLNGSLNLYISRLLGLFRFLVALIDGANGLHGHLLSADIDAITLKLVDRNPSMSKVDPDVNESEFLQSVSDLLENLLHATSNLHEELHHSFMQYFFLDASHFLALPEYGPSLLLLTAPLLWLFHEGHRHQIDPAQKQRFEMIMYPDFVVDAIVSSVAVVGVFGVRHWLLQHWRIGEELSTCVVIIVFLALTLLPGLLMLWRRFFLTETVAGAKSARWGLIVYQRQQSAGLLVLLAAVAARHFALATLLAIPTTATTLLCSVHVGWQHSSSSPSTAVDGRGHRRTRARLWLQTAVCVVLSPTTLLLASHWRRPSAAAQLLARMDEGGSIVPPALLLFSQLLSLGALQAAMN